MNTKIAMSAVSIFAALAVMGGATYAAFSSQASNNNNTFAAGTMSLQINGQPEASSAPLFNATPSAPGGSIDAQMNLGNSGSVAATSVKVVGIDLNGPNNDLAPYLTLQIGLDDGSNGGTPNDGVIDTVLGSAPLDSAGWNNYVLPGVTIPATSVTHLAAKLMFDISAPNSVQGHTLGFDINLEAGQ